MSKRASSKITRTDVAPGRFVDLFAGCGGLSLGLMASGWAGIFAVEQDTLAFETLKYNLVEGNANSPHHYDWPNWFKKSPVEISQFIEQHRSDLQSIAGSVDLLAGGPPCQGFSLAGRRKSNDPRNELFKYYVELVNILKPPFLLLENVRGISVAFRKPAEVATTTEPAKAFSDQIKESVEAANYNVFTRLVRAMDVGVPQFRPRYIMLAIRKDLLEGQKEFDPFADFEDSRKRFLKQKGLRTDRPVTVKQAISDLEKKGKQIIECVDSPGFKQIAYSHPKTKYQRLLHGTLNGTAPNSLRLANHQDETKKRFRKILSSCRHGVQLNSEDRQRFGLKKHCTVPLDGAKPSHTLTTLPDDFLHYSEPRILTVREYARLQSFPDWYEFRGKYTTGGDRRLRECPRYTQAGNAVPPFLAEFVGVLIAVIRQQLATKPTQGSRCPLT